MIITLIITTLHAYVNTRNISYLSILNEWNVFWSCAGLILMIAVLSYFAPHQQASWVFTHFENETGFDNPVYVFMLGAIGASYSLFGKIRVCMLHKKISLIFRLWMCCICQWRNTRRRYFFSNVNLIHFTLLKSVNSLCVCLCT